MVIRWTALRSASAVLACAASIVLAAPTAFGNGPLTRDGKDEKPSIAVKASPQIGFAPFNATLSAELRGGQDDYEQFYCATVEWDMGDGNRSEQKIDCDPYEAGKSQIRRRYTLSQTFDTAGEFRVQFRLKQKGKVVASGSTTVRVRPGIRDIGRQP
jgi:hypothetical protein